MRPVELQDVAVEDVTLPQRHRKDMGDLQALARSIDEAGLLQPIGLDLSLTLLWGERRFRAMRDVLGWLTVPALVMDMDALGTDPLVAERDENEQRLALATSERVEIARAIRERIGERRGRPTEDTEEAENIVGNCPQLNPGEKTRSAAAAHAGFDSEKTFRRAEQVVEKGTPEVIKAMDDGTISISAAADVAALAPTEQARVIKEVEAGKKPTVALAEARARTIGPPPTQEESEKVIEEWKDRPVGTTVTPDLVDEEGIPVPAALAEVFAGCEEFDELIKILRGVQKRIGALAEQPAGGVLVKQLGKRGKSAEEARCYCEHVKNAITKLQFARPHAAVCPWCHYEKRVDPNCTACRGEGWVTKLSWKNAPEDCRTIAKADGLEGGAE